MEVPATFSRSSLLGTTSRSLAKLIFKAEHPEIFVRSIPAQSLYLAVKQQGLDASGDLLEIATLEQCQVMLDLDLWHRDHFHEENLWEWLAAPDAVDDLDLLKKLVSVIDLRLISMVMARYVKSQTNVEPTEMMPGPGYHTPDKGHTWIKVETGDTHRDFLLSRLLAILFEINADLFYQLLNVPTLATPTMLEEEAYQEKLKRLTCEGLPLDEDAHRINAPLDPSTAIREMKTGLYRPAVECIPAVTPLLHDTRLIQPLAGLVSRLPEPEEFVSEFTLIMNAALVYWQKEIYEIEQVRSLAQQVKGSINIALQTVATAAAADTLDVYQHLGLQKLYACGLARILPLRKRALRVTDDTLRSLQQEQAAFAIIAGLREPFPEMPNFFNPDGTLQATQDGALERGYKAIETVQELESLSAFLEMKQL